MACGRERQLGAKPRAEQWMIGAIYLDTLSTEELFQLRHHVRRLGNYVFCQILKLFSGDKLDFEGFLPGFVQQCRVVEGFDEGSAKRFYLIRSRAGRSHCRP